MNRDEACPGNTSVCFQNKIKQTKKYIYTLKDLVTTNLIFKRAVIKITEKKIILLSDTKSFKIL